MNRYFGFFKPLLIISIPIFIIHYFIFEFTSLQEKKEAFYYSISFLYLLFFILSKISLFIISKVAQKNFDATGMAFMLITTLKTIIAFLFAKPILDNSFSSNIEKANYFFIFIFFLTIETIISIKILNKKS